MKDEGFPIADQDDDAIFRYGDMCPSEAGPPPASPAPISSAEARFSDVDEVPSRLTCAAPLGALLLEFSSPNRERRQNPRPTARPSRDVFLSHDDTRHQ